MGGHGAPPQMHWMRAMIVVATLLVLGAAVSIAVAWRIAVDDHRPVRRRIGWVCTCSAPRLITIFDRPGTTLVRHESGAWWGAGNAVTEPAFRSELPAWSDYRGAPLCGHDIERDDGATTTVAVGWPFRCLLDTWTTWNDGPLPLAVPRRPVWGGLIGNTFFYGAIVGGAGLLLARLRRMQRRWRGRCARCGRRPGDPVRCRHCGGCDRWMEWSPRAVMPAIGAALLIGALVTAGAIVASSYRGPASDPYRAAGVGPAPEHWRVFQYLGSARGARVHWQPMNAPVRRTSAVLPRWCRSGACPQRGGACFEDARGWPLLATRCHGHVPWDGSTATLQGAIEIDPWPGADLETVRMIPVIPIWPGLVGNVLLLAGAVLVAALIAGDARRAWRRRRGRCPVCAYPQGVGETCSECGRRVHRRPADAAP